MYGSECHNVMDDDPLPLPPAAAPNGSKVVTLLFRLSTLALALTSAVVMATASDCTIIYDDNDVLHGGGGGGATVVVTFKDYQPFVYLVGSNIAATILEVAAIYLQVVGTTNDGGNGGSGEVEEDAPPPSSPPPILLPRVVLVAAEVAVQVLLYSATGAVFAAVMAYGPQISACTGAGGGAGPHFCEQVQRSKIMSLAASVSVGLASIAKDVPLPFSVWPHM